jgi:hypothetical protein
MPRKRRTTEPQAGSAPERIAELEADLRQCDEKIKELRTDLAKAEELVAEEREHVEEAGRVMDQWIDAFDMTQNDAGLWTTEPAMTVLLDRYNALAEQHRKLVRAWNKFVPEYNARVAPREMGRPPAASDAQRADVRKRRKGGQSLRAIATATGLSTVRTIIAGRARKRTNELRRMEFDRLRAAAYRARSAPRMRCRSRSPRRRNKARR